MREERLRATAGLRGGLDLSSWRGRSGRRYVVGVHALSEPEVVEVTDAVMIAVGRDESGLARVIDVLDAGPQARARAKARWMARMRARGATELHVHRLAEDARERQAVIADLKEAEASPAVGG